MADRTALMREALFSILKMCPLENPGPARDGWGWHSIGNYDDVARDSRREALWRVAVVAREGLEGKADD